MQFWNWLKSWFASPMGQMFTRSGAVVLAAVTQAGEAILVDLATQYVAEAERTYGPGNGDVKFDAALNRLKVAAVKAGVQAGTGVLETVVQNAWQASQQPSPSPTKPAP